LRLFPALQGLPCLLSHSVKMSWPEVPDKELKLFFGAVSWILALVVLAAILLFT